MMPLQLFNNLAFSGANLLSFFLYAGLNAGMLFLSLNLVQIQGYSQLQSGLTFLPFTLLMITIARFAGSLADTYGSRQFLIFGPALAGLGLFILSFIKLTDGPSAYWTTFFPGIFVFGLGMSFTVAPLTTTVMGSAEAQLSGIASGINNAVTRIAAVFANAIFGVLAIMFFSGALADQIESIKLSKSQQQTVMAQSINLGNAKVPASLIMPSNEAVQKAYSQSFISAYSKIMRISAVLGLIGGLMGFVFVRNTAVKKEVK
jgi:MFS family permease